MNLYTIYSESHKYIFENHFLNSLPNEFNVISTEISQECLTGEYDSQGFDITCFKKIEIFIKACENNFGKTFIYSDADVQFFGNIKEELIKQLEDCDIACQNDYWGGYCSGFFICKANENTLNMFKEMKNNYLYGIGNNDQTILNACIHMCKAKLLSKRFFTFIHSNPTVIHWNEHIDFSIPPDILVHHANWTIGIENKIKLLEYVRKLYTNLI